MEDLTVRCDNFDFSYKTFEELDENWFKKHMHPFYEILYVDDGEITFIIEDKVYKLKKGDVVLISPAKYHFVKSIETAPYKRFCLMFHTTAVKDAELVGKVFGQGEKFTLPYDNAAITLFNTFISLAGTIDAEKRESLIEDMFSPMLIGLLNLSDTTEKTAWFDKNGRKIIEYINENYLEIKCLDDLCRALFFSKSYVNHFFRNNLNIGVMKFIDNKKIYYAHKLIREGCKPTEIYEKCGFANYVSFFRQYKRCFGFSPSKTDDFKR